MEKINYKKDSIGIIGLGYVGLPLAIEFANIIKVIGFDLDKKRINELNNNFDRTREVSKNKISKTRNIIYTNNQSKLCHCKIYIVTVPTPINKNKIPDLSNILNACKILGGLIHKNNIIIFESTVYPGATEEECVPILEKYSKLKYNVDFFCGYSPERINPGDKLHTVKNIIKVVSGSNKNVTKTINNLYKKIVTAGTYIAPSIKVAEAAKAIENTQRDLNIAYVNELSIIFDKMNIETREVLAAAETKWNFIKFEPGLVGGHCISVDPYYLTYKSKKEGYEPKFILSGRKINDGMAKYIANKFHKKFTDNNIKIKKPKILIMGLTFKENCPDIRNTQIVNVVKALKSKNYAVDIYDPWVDPKEAKSQYGLNLKFNLKDNQYEGIIIAVAHDIFKKMGETRIYKLMKKKSVLFDFKNLLIKK